MLANVSIRTSLGWTGMLGQLNLIHFLSLQPMGSLLHVASTHNLSMWCLQQIQGLLTWQLSATNDKHSKEQEREDNWTSSNVVSVLALLLHLVGLCSHRSAQSQFKGIYTKTMAHQGPYMEEQLSYFLFTKSQLLLDDFFQVYMQKLPALKDSLCSS